jgi:hypothetical protein
VEERGAFIGGVVTQDQLLIGQILASCAVPPTGLGGFVWLIAFSEWVEGLRLKRRLMVEFSEYVEGSR